MLKNINKQKVATNKGITLIALVVTIVVLLILAGITISLVLSEGGIFSTAKRAQEIQNEAVIKEKVQIMLADAQLEKLINDTDLKTYLEAQGYTVTENETAGTVKITVDGYNVTINSSTLEIIGMESNTNTNSPIKFYQPYKYTVVEEGYGETRMDYIFHEDGSIDMYSIYINVNGVSVGGVETMPAGTFSYKTDGVYMEDEKVLTIGLNGSYVQMEDGLQFDLVPTTVQYLQYGKTYVHDSEYGSGYVILYEDGAITIELNGGVQTMPAGTVSYQERTYSIDGTFFPIYPDGTKIVYDGILFEIGCAHLNTEIRNQSNSYTGDIYCTDCNKLITEGSCKHVNTEIRNQTNSYTGDIYCTDCGILIQAGAKPIVTELINKPVANTNTYAQDKYGNKIVIPAGFTVVANGTQGVVYDWDKEDGVSTNEPVVQDGIVIKHGTDGNEFVWVPVGEIKNDAVENTTNTTNIQLGRYDYQWGMNTSTNPPTPPSPKQVANKDTYDTTTANDLVNNSYFENSTGEYNGYVYKSPEHTNEDQQGANFETLGSWIANTIDNGGYYIARYEASYGTNGVALSKPSTGTPLTNNATSPYTKTVGQLYNWITQPDASTASKAMYPNGTEVEYYSELVNSYAWDTAIIFIQTYDDVDYASTPSAYKDEDTTTYDPANTGERGATVEVEGSENTTDKVCNIYDMASNCSEWTTETNMTYSSPCISRGDDFRIYESYTRSRTYAYASERP